MFGNKLKKPIVYGNAKHNMTKSSNINFEFGKPRACSVSMWRGSCHVDNKYMVIYCIKYGIELCNRYMAIVKEII